MKFLTALFISFSLYATGPDFLVLGAQKGGTTSLYDYLKDHPDIKMPKRKELHFFDDDFEKGIQYYLNQFPSLKKQDSSLTGDITPRYLPYTKAAKRAFTHFPKAKLIVLLRNPVDRAFSRYKNHFSSGEVKNTFEHCIKKEMAKITSGQPHCDFYLVRGFYAEQLKNWLQYYPKEQLLVIISEDFFKNTQECMDKIYNFLELPPHKHASFPISFKSTEQLVLKPETRALLEEFYRPYNEELQQLFDELNLNITLKWNKS